MNLVIYILAAFGFFVLLLLIWKISDPQGFEEFAESLGSDEEKGEDQ